MNPRRTMLSLGETDELFGRAPNDPEQQSARSRPPAVAALGIAISLFALSGCDQERSAAERTLEDEVSSTPAPKDPKAEVGVTVSESDGDAISASLNMIHEKLMDMR